jgi:hypothetical protein
MDVRETGCEDVDWIQLTHNRHIGKLLLHSDDPFGRRNNYGTLATCYLIKGKR